MLISEPGDMSSCRQLGACWESRIRYVLSDASNTRIFNLSTLQQASITTARQPDSPTARQPDSPTARQPDSPTARQPDSPILRYSDTSTSLHLDKLTRRQIGTSVRQGITFPIKHVDTMTGRPENRPSRRHVVEFPFVHACVDS